MVSETKKAEIERQAQKILEDFGKKLGKAGMGKAKNLDSGIISVRNEIKGEKCDMDFRKRMFDNAPMKDKDYIIAERAAW